MIESCYQKEIVKRICKCCRKWRKKSGYTQKDIASLYCIAPESVSAFENGRLTNILYVLMYTELYNSCAAEISDIIRG